MIGKAISIIVRKCKAIKAIAKLDAIAIIKLAKKCL